MWKDYVMENKEKEMTDKEMIEFAAKAYWNNEVPPHIQFGEKGIMLIHGGVWWIPLEHLSDALRLADELGMVITCTPGIIQVESENKSIVRTGSFQSWSDAKIGLKRLIVQVAAEIGKGMRVIPEISEERKHMHEAMCSSPCISLNSLVEKYREFKHLDEKREKFYTAVLNGTPPSLDNYPE